MLESAQAARVAGARQRRLDGMTRAYVGHISGRALCGSRPTAEHAPFPIKDEQHLALPDQIPML